MYTIHGEGVSFYTIPTAVDLTNPDTVDIHVAEGPFDILSICYNTCGGIKMNKIYTASCGKGYENVIRMYLLDYNIMNARFHVYLDNDVEDSILYRISILIQNLGMELYIHRNTLVYRVEKLQKSTGLDVRTFDDALTFKIAMMVYNYMKYLDGNNS